MLARNKHFELMGGVCVEVMLVHTRFCAPMFSGECVDSNANEHTLETIGSIVCITMDRAVD